MNREIQSQTTDTIGISREDRRVPTGVDPTDDVCDTEAVGAERRRRWFPFPEFSQALRWCGGTLLATAGIAFMLQGVYSFSPMTRHWMMLSTCVLPAVLGGITGVWMKEAKGARTFFGFATASFPALASQMGAMVFSLFGQPPGGMPQPLVFSLPTLGMVSLITAFTLVVAVAVSHFGFRIMDRANALRLTGLYAFANMLVLIPVREGAAAGLVIACGAAVVYWFDVNVLRKDFRLDTFEGRTCRLLPVAPLLVMIGRNFFYPSP